VLTRLVAVLLAFGPGALLGFALPAGRYRWATWASAPILTLGLTSIGVTWLPRLGLPNGTTAVLVTELVVAAAAVTAAQVLSRRRPAQPAQPADPGEPAEPAGRAWPRIPDLIAVGIPALVSLAFGRIVLGHFRFPIGWDSMNHAVLTGNIIQTGSTAIGDACSSGSTVRVVSCNFYPVAVDVSFAQAANLSGGPVSVAMTTWSMVIGPLALVAALYVVVRLMGGRPLVAGCAAVLPAVMGPLWEQQLSGRVTGALPGFGVMIAVLITLAVRERHPLRLGLLAGLASAGLLMTHTYDIFFAGTIAVAVLITIRGRWRVGQAALALGAAALAAVLTVAPVLSDLLGAGTERTARTALFAGHLPAALEYWVTDLRRYALFGYPLPGSVHTLPATIAVQVAVWLAVICVIASPLCFVFARLRWGRPWLIAWAVWTLIGIWTTVSSTGPAASLAHLWYGEPQRLRDMVFIVYPMMAVVGACAIGTCVQLLASRSATRTATEGAASRRSSPLRRLGSAAVPSVAAAVLVVPLVGLAAVPNSSLPLRAALSQQTPLGSAYPRVYRWLAQHTPKGSVVAWNRNVEFFPWAFADYKVSPLFGIPDLIPANRLNASQRYMAWDFLVDNAYNRAQAGCLVRKFRIAYVVVGAHHIPGTYKGQLLHTKVSTSPNVDLVHTDGSLHVYQVNASGLACASAG
jgi:hypothetical protein